MHFSIICNSFVSFEKKIKRKVTGKNGNSNRAWVSVASEKMWINRSYLTHPLSRTTTIPQQTGPGSYLKKKHCKKKSQTCKINDNLGLNGFLKIFVAKNGIDAGYQYAWIKIHACANLF